MAERFCSRRALGELLRDSLGCDDGEDYRKISWGQPQLEQQQLSNLLTGNQIRARTIINNWRNLVADTRQWRY